MGGQRSPPRATALTAPLVHLPMLIALHSAIQPNCFIENLRALKCGQAACKFLPKAVWYTCVRSVAGMRSPAAQGVGEQLRCWRAHPGPGAAQYTSHTCAGSLSGRHGAGLRLRAQAGSE